MKSVQFTALLLGALVAFGVAYPSPRREMEQLIQSLLTSNTQQESDSCDLVPPVEYATVLATAVEYSCKPGYTMVGDAIVTCSTEGRQQPPICEPSFSCGNPPTIENGIIDQEASDVSNGLNSMKEYICAVGYQFPNGEASAIISCQANEEWESLPDCQLVQCNETEIGSLKSGKVVTNGLTFQSIVTYSCYGGFKLDGDKTRTCQSTGEWSGTQPKCRSCKRKGTFCTSGSQCCNGLRCLLVKAEGWDWGVELTQRRNGQKECRQQ